MNCLMRPDLPTECRWKVGTDVGTTTPRPAGALNLGNAFSQPCANGCLWEGCRKIYDVCTFLNAGATTIQCNAEVQNLNHCRDCQFSRCEERCVNTCDTFSEFHWWGHPRESCSGCPGISNGRCGTAHNVTGNEQYTIPRRNTPHQREGRYT